MPWLTSDEPWRSYVSSTQSQRIAPKVHSRPSKNLQLPPDRCSRGLDKLRLRVLAGSEVEPSSADFTFCSKLSQGAEDVRPVGMGSVLRKIASKCLWKALEDFNEKHFKPWQFAMQRGGCVEIIHSLRTFTQAQPTWDVYTIDADNAFNRAERRTGLSELKKHEQLNGPFLRNMYLGDSVAAIKSRAGYHQGDILATFMYILTIKPPFQRMHDIFVPSSIPI
eukprot:gene26834-32430_t